MNVLSLFDGISCGHVALERAGIKVDRYFASEIDKYAIHITQKNYPNTIQLGDITKWREWDIDWKTIDIIFAGSPCQGFSFAGKQLNFDDPRSKLFFDFVDILNHVRNINPNVIFLLENVKMKKEYQDVISEKLGVEPILINSALVSAQNRKRLYWTNIPNITQPADKQIFLKNVLEKRECFLGYKISEKTKKWILNKNYSKPKILPEKTGCMNSRNNSPSLRSDSGTTFIPLLYQLPHGANKGGIKAKNGTTPSITSSAWQYNNFLINNFRRLTEIECERLQTLPDNYTEGISNSQRHRALGNAWTVDVIVHILKNINGENP